MPSTALILLASIPLVLLLLPRWIEPYALWDPAVLNGRPASDPRAGERTTRWCNMGWWADSDSFPDAAEALGLKLLTLAAAGEGGYKGGGHVLDIAHGAGESLLLHLSSTNPPQRLSALASISADTASAQALVSDLHGNPSTVVDYFTYSAQFRVGKDVGHPLDRMRGYLGDGGAARGRKSWDDDPDPDFDDDAEDAYRSEKDELSESGDSSGPESGGAGRSDAGYDLIYILDAIYHFPPSIPTFLSSTTPVLSPRGIIAYTDILPPPSLPLYQRFLLSYLFSVPLSNLRRSNDLAVYRKQLEGLGFEDVIVEDWSHGVWPGFSKNLGARGGAWNLVGRAVQGADVTGWKFVGVRAKKAAPGQS